MLQKTEQTLHLLKTLIPDREWVEAWDKAKAWVAVKVPVKEEEWDLGQEMAVVKAREVAEEDKF
jgi:hypothetical protein